MTGSKEVLITLNKDQALVLFEFVARFNETNHKVLFEDQAEQKMMWLIQRQLEKVLVEPFMPNYKDIVKEARNKIRDNEL